jgi:hypothetical protein
MIGLEVKYKNKVFNIAADSFSGVMIAKRNEELYLDVGSLDKNNFVRQWVVRNHLEIGDEISVSVKDISQITKPVREFPFEEMDKHSEKATDMDIKQMYQEKLAYFHALEKLLSKEGLIEIN